MHIFIVWWKHLHLIEVCYWIDSNNNTFDAYARSNTWMIPLLFFEYLNKKTPLINQRTTGFPATPNTMRNTQIDRLSLNQVQHFETLLHVHLLVFVHLQIKKNMFYAGQLYFYSSRNLYRLPFSAQCDSCILVVWANNAPRPEGIAYCKKPEIIRKLGRDRFALHFSVNM